MTTANLPSHSHSCNSTNTDHTHNIDIYTSEMLNSDKTTTSTYATITNLQKMIWEYAVATGRASLAGTSNVYTTGSEAGKKYSGFSINLSHIHRITGTTNSMSSNLTHSHTIGSTGSGTAFSILPPYVVKYCFERTA